MTPSDLLVMSTPAGTMELRSTDEALIAARFVDENTPLTSAGEAPSPVLEEARGQLTAYFAGRLTQFDLVLDARGSLFQHRVWEQLSTIAFGETTSYGAIARQLGMSAGASRAVGMANGANPIAIVVPCHRVIGSNGKLVGYSGGMTRKRFLLDLEATARQPVLS